MVKKTTIAAAFLELDLIELVNSFAVQDENQQTSSH